MNRSPLFPNIPWLGTVARWMIFAAFVLALVGAVGALSADLSLRGVVTLSGAVLALAGTGKCLLTERNNFPAWACGVAGWLIVALV